MDPPDGDKDFIIRMLLKYPPKRMPSTWSDDGREGPLSYLASGLPRPVAMRNDEPLIQQVPGAIHDGNRAQFVREMLLPVSHPKPWSQTAEIELRANELKAAAHLFDAEHQMERMRSSQFSGNVTWGF